MDLEFLAYFVPMVGVGLYWWLGRGRAVGFLFSWLAFGGAMRAAGLLGVRARFNVYCVGLSALAGILVIGWRLPVKGRKTCPACAETVKSAAAVCKHCGHKFAENASNIQGTMA